MVGRSGVARSILKRRFDADLLFVNDWEAAELEAEELAKSVEIPPHVPPEMVRNLTMGRGLTTTRPPHAVVDDIHRDFPTVFYAPNLMNGGGWVFRKRYNRQHPAVDFGYSNNYRGIRRSAWVRRFSTAAAAT